MPTPYRLAPEVALRLLRDGVLSRGTAVGIGVESYVALLERAVLRGVTGGRVYDALILATAREAGADFVVTLNPRHFHGIDLDIEVREPEAP